MSLTRWPSHLAVPTTGAAHVCCADMQTENYRAVALVYRSTIRDMLTPAAPSAIAAAQTSVTVVPLNGASPNTNATGG